MRRRDGLAYPNFRNIGESGDEALDNFFHRTRLVLGFSGIHRRILPARALVVLPQRFIIASSDGHRVVGCPLRARSMIGTMTTSRLTTSRQWVGVEPAQRIPEQVTAAQPRWRRPARPRTGQHVPERAPNLIDGLIDRVHTDWPETSFILSLPSGEQIFMPWHVDGPPCAVDHTGYFRRCVLPFCQVSPSRGGGRCRMTPVALDDQPARTPFYAVDLRTGMLVMGAGPVPLAGRLASGGSQHAAHCQR